MSKISDYQPPQHGILSYLPSSWVPYAELMRLHRPVGILNIYFPYLFGSLYAACIMEPTGNPSSVVTTNLVLLLAAFVLRSAGCTWNDLVDSDLDRQVTRCRLRPVARGAVSKRNGCIFTAVQYSIWLAILAPICPQYINYAAPLVLMVTFYPFAKRITSYAQVVLGFTLGWGVLIGCLVQGVDPKALAVQKPTTQGAGLICLYLCYVVWAVIHDTVYAQQDVRDDKQAGIKSMAVLYSGRMKILLWGLSVVQLGLLAATGKLFGAGPLYYIGACIGTGALLISMVWRLEPNDPVNCCWWFQNGCLIVGATISAGLLGEYMDRQAEQMVGAWVLNKLYLLE